MLQDVVELLRCPSCAEGLELQRGAVRCPRGHAFDVARQGYVNLLTGHLPPGSADTAAMVAARDEFLGAGHYAEIETAVASACAEAAGHSPDGSLVDIGAGTGHYLAVSLGRLPGYVGIALDVSKHALRRAARAHPRIGAVACDSWRSLPLRNATATVALSVFAPRNGAETARVLQAGGTFVVVTPSERHLAELIPALGLLSVDEHKHERLEQALGPFFELRRRTSCETELRLSHRDAAALVAMGPSARHSDPDVVATRIAELPEPLTATAAVEISVYQRR